MAEMNSFYPPEDDAGSAPASAQADAGDQDPKKADDEKGEGESALLPKSLFAGKEVQPGEEITLKVVRLYDDEVEVECCAGGDKPGKEGEANTDTGGEDMEAAMGKIGSMAS
jgi:hypothetical protein